MIKSDKLMKNHSLQLKKKINSQTKLAHLTLIDSQVPSQAGNFTSISDRNKHQQSQKKLRRNSLTKKLNPLNNKSSSRFIITEKIAKGDAQAKQKVQLSRQITQKVDLSRKPRHQREAIKSGSSKSETFAKEVPQHPVFDKIRPLLSHEASSDLQPAKMYLERLVGECSAQWWCIVDSLFLSLRRIIKVKKPVEQNTENHSKNPQKWSRIFRAKQDKHEPKSQTQQTSPGTVLTNIKSSIEFAKVYSCLEHELMANERRILKCFEDASHFSLILEALFYEKAMIYLLGSISKWNQSQEPLHIHWLATQLIPYLLDNRKLMIQILMEAVENELYDNKIRKPKYIAREKKLIQISKSVSMIKNEYDKCQKNLDAPDRYATLQYTYLREHAELLEIESKWRKLIFDFPLAPYLPLKTNSKQYLVVIEPLNILYKYNMKQEVLSLDTYADNFLKSLSQYFDIVFFTHVDKESSLLNFMRSIDHVDIYKVLDKHYITYKEAKPIKNIHKLGGSYPLKNILVIDEKNNSKYYPSECNENCLLIDGNYSQTKLIKMGTKLVKIQDENDDYLKDLSVKIIKSAQAGGHWQHLFSECRKSRWSQNSP